ncbi:MAG: DUF3969 family protein [Oscillospiraceae bacterium]|nr:DUF3969 family protein [Oscillospiraceae bacterium]
MNLTIKISGHRYIETYLSIVSVGALACIEKGLIDYDDAMGIIYRPGMIEKAEILFPRISKVLHLGWELDAICGLIPEQLKQVVEKMRDISYNSVKFNQDGTQHILYKIEETHRLEPLEDEARRSEYKKKFKTRWLLFYRLVKRKQLGMTIKISGDGYIETYLSIVSLGALACIEKGLIDCDDAKSIIYQPALLEELKKTVSVFGEALCLGLELDGISNAMPEKIKSDLENIRRLNYNAVKFKPNGYQDLLYTLEE